MKYLVFICLLLSLSGCATNNNPLANIPTNQKIFLMAEKQQALNKTVQKPSQLTVAEMLGKIRRNTKKNTLPGLNNDYYVTLIYTNQQIAPTNKQIEKISNILRNIPNRKDYLLQISTGLANSSNKIKGLKQSNFRVALLQAELKNQVKQVNARIAPNQSPNTVYLQFVAPTKVYNK